MYIQKLANAAASKITITTTATSLLDLIATAGSAAHGVPGTSNAFDIMLEDGDVRMLMDGNTPTSSNGLLLKSGGIYSFRNVPLTKVMLIRVSGDVAASVQVGQSAETEASGVGIGGTVSGSITVDSEFPAAASAADAAANPSTTSVKALEHGFNGTTWDRIRAGISAATATLTGFLNTLPWAIYNTTPPTKTNGQGGPLQTDATGGLLTSDKSLRGPGAPSIDSYTHAAVSAAVTTADQSLVAAPGASKQIWVYGIQGVTAAAGTVSFQDEDNTAISGVMSFAANGGMAVAPSGNFSMPLWKLATNKALEVDTAGGADFKGSIQYAIVSV